MGVGGQSYNLFGLVRLRHIFRVQYWTGLIRGTDNFLGFKVLYCRMNVSVTYFAGYSAIHLALEL